MADESSEKPTQDKPYAEKPQAQQSAQQAQSAQHVQAAPVSATPTQQAPSASQSAPRAQDDGEPAPRAGAAPAAPGSALRHPSQVRVTTTRSDLATNPSQINSHTVSIPWNPDASRGEDNEVNVPPDAHRALRTGLAFHVAAGYEAIVTCAGGEPGHRIPVAWLQGRAKDELVIRFRNSSAQTRTFLAGQELAQLTLRKLEALDMAFSDPHADKADEDE